MYNVFFLFFYIYTYQYTLGHRVTVYILDYVIVLVLANLYVYNQKKTTIEVVRNYANAAFFIPFHVLL